MKYLNGKEIRIVLLVLATGYLWMVMSCAPENQTTQNRRYEANVARRQAQQEQTLSENSDGTKTVFDLKDNSIKQVPNTDSTNSAGSAKTANAKTNNQTKTASNASSEGLKITTSEMQLSLALKINCGESKNALCQKDAKIQKTFVEKVKTTDDANVNWVDTANDNGYNELTQVQTLDSPLEVTLKEAIDSLDKNIDLIQTNPHVEIESANAAGKTLHCEIDDDRTAKDQQKSSPKFLILSANSIDDDSRTSAYAETFSQVAGAIKTPYFSVRRATSTLICQASNAGNLKDAKNLLIYQTLIGHTLAAVFSAKTSTRAIASVEGEEVFQGLFQGTPWIYKSARVHKIISEKNPFMTIELFEQDIAPNQICSVTFPDNARKVFVKVPLNAQKMQWIAETDDAEISISSRELSSKKQAFYHDLRIPLDVLNDASTNNMNLFLDIDNAHGTRIRGKFTAEICQK